MRISVSKTTHLNGQSITKTADIETNECEFPESIKMMISVMLEGLDHKHPKDTQPPLPPPTPEQPQPT